MYLEYPKTLYREDGDSIVVKDADGEAAAGADGYTALPAAPPDTPELLRSLPSHLEYPKHVFRDLESVVVKDATEEAARALEGYAPLTPAVSDPVTESPKKRTKKA